MEHVETCYGTELQHYAATILNVGYCGIRQLSLCSYFHVLYG